MTDPGNGRPRRRHLAWMLLAVAVISIGVPAGRDWWLFAIMRGDWPAPKGWPFGEPWRDWDKPTDPRELAAYEYTHALKLPESMPKPVPFDFTAHLLSSRRQTAAAYFEHLCRTEAGEYIFKKVEDVEAIYQMRPMPKRDDRILRDRYGFEDPADWSGREADGSPMLFIGGPFNGFRIFESFRAPPEITNRHEIKRWMIGAWNGIGRPPYWRYHDFDYTTSSARQRLRGTVEAVSTLTSRYAYTWRGIRREKDRWFGIAGGELIVLDRLTGEVMGVRRGFAIAHQYPRHLDWEFANFCPDMLRVDRKIRLLDKTDYPFSFVFQVLEPVDYDTSKFRIN